MFALPVTVYEIIKFNLSKWAVIESMTLRSKSISLGYNIAEYVIGLNFNAIHDGRKNGEFDLKPVSYDLPISIHLFSVTVRMSCNTQEHRVRGAGIRQVASRK